MGPAYIVGHFSPYAWRHWPVEIKLTHHFSRETRDAITVEGLHGGPAEIRCDNGKPGLESNLSNGLIDFPVGPTSLVPTYGLAKTRCVFGGTGQMFGNGWGIVHIEHFEAKGRSTSDINELAKQLRL
jgi:hypothetical protein